jgi:hypothetical protein
VEEFYLAPDEFYNSLNVFTKEIDTDPYLLFHGTNMLYYDSICEHGLDASSNLLFSKNNVSEVVSFFEKIGWEGYRVGRGLAVLKPFSLDFDYSNRDKKSVFLGELPIRSLLYATSDYIGGETCRALRACLEDLVTLQNSPDDLQRLAVDKDVITTFLAGVEDIFQKVKQQENEISSGVVLVIKVPQTKYDQLEYSNSMGVMIDIVPPEWILARCVIPSDFQFDPSIIYPECTKMMVKKRNKKLGIMNHFFPDYISLEDWEKTDEYAKFFKNS